HLQGRAVAGGAGRRRAGPDRPGGPGQGGGGDGGEPATRRWKEGVTMQALRSRIAAELDRARTRTRLLADAVDDADLVKQHSPLMSPLVWDLAHVGNQEELWLVRDVGGREPVRSDIDHLYDAARRPRRVRPQLPVLGPAEARAYGDTVRDRVLELLDRVPLEGRRLVTDGFAFGMIVQHEQQHDETMLATHQLRVGEPVLSA